MAIEGVRAAGKTILATNLQHALLNEYRLLPAPTRNTEQDAEQELRAHFHRHHRALRLAASNKGVLLDGSIFAHIANLRLEIQRGLHADHDALFLGDLADRMLALLSPPHAVIHLDVSVAECLRRSAALESRPPSPLELDASSKALRSLSDWYRTQGTAVYSRVSDRFCSVLAARDAVLSTLPAAKQLCERAPLPAEAVAFALEDLVAEARAVAQASLSKGVSVRRISDSTTSTASFDDWEGLELPEPAEITTLSPRMAKMMTEGPATSPATVMVDPGEA